MRTRLLLICFLLLTPATLLAQAQGDWVLARWQGGEHWFPGVVSAVTGSKITVAYDDGATETLSADKVRVYNWQVGTRVECRWKGGAEWYGASITKMNAKDGARINVKYDDGVSERSRTGLCRSR